MLEELIELVTRARDELPPSPLNTKKPKLVLKIAPDLDESAIKDIAEAVKTVKGVDGIIVSNTTIQRPESLTHRMQIIFSHSIAESIYDI